MIMEAWILLGAVLLGIIHISGQSFALKLSVGNRWTVGSRDEPVEAGVLAGRWDRALRNFLETFPLFAALVLLAIATDRSNAFTAWGSAIYLAGRVFYLPAYLSGIPWARTICWKLATAGLALVGIGVAIA